MLPSDFDVRLESEKFLCVLHTLNPSLSGVASDIYLMEVMGRRRRSLRLGPRRQVSVDSFLQGSFSFPNLDSAVTV